ncbi:hypothetical protein BREVUG8_70089 [Brevundimonas sp. G8]|nr:hypothetical protein BREVUG8_70089 [Brevundimonas sp. G8]
MQGQVDAVIADPALRIVVGADPFRPVARSDLGLARIGPGQVLGLALHVVQAHAQVLHRLVSVDVLGLLRRGHHDAGGQVGDAHGGIGRIDVLTARAGGAEGVDADVLVVDFDLDVLDLGQDRDRRRRGVDAPLRLGRRHALHPVDAALELQPAEHAVAGDRGDDFLVAASVALGRRIQLDPPAARGGVAGVHAEQVAGEKSRLVAAGAGAHFQHGRGVLVGVARGQQQGHLAFQARQGFTQDLQLVLRHRRHFGVGRHGFQVRHLGAGAGQALNRVGHGLQFGMFLGQAHDLGAVGDRAHARFDFVEAVEHLIETGLGQSQDGNILRKRKGPSLPAGGGRVDCKPSHRPGAALVIGDNATVTMASEAVTKRGSTA